MSSAAVDYCLQKLENTNSDSEHFHNVVMVKVIGTNTPITIIDPNVRYNLFEKVDFFRLMRPDVVITGEPHQVVQNVMLGLLKWFLQCPRLLIHERMFQLLPFIAANFKNANHDTENDIYEENIKQSYRIVEILAESPVGLDELIKAKVPNSLCVPAGVFNGCSVAKELLVRFALQRGRDIWYNRDIAELESFLLKYANWIKIQRIDTNVQELEMLRVILTSIDPTIHERKADDSWGSIIREVIVTFFCSKPCAEDRDITLGLAIQLVRIFGMTFIVEPDPKFLMQMVLLASTQICVHLKNAGTEGPVGKNLLNDCCCFLEYITKHVYLQKEHIKFYGLMRGAVHAVVRFLKSIAPLNKHQQETEDRQVKYYEDKGTLGAEDGKGGYVNDNRPTGTTELGCSVSKSVAANEKPEKTIIVKAEHKCNDYKVKCMGDELTNVVLENGGDGSDQKRQDESVNDKDRNITEIQLGMAQPISNCESKDTNNLLHGEVSSRNMKVCKAEKPPGNNNEIIKGSPSEKIILGHLEVTKSLDVGIGTETTSTDADKLQTEETPQTAGEKATQNLMRYGQNRNHGHKVAQKKTEEHSKDDIMRSNDSGHETLNDIDQHVQNVKITTREEQISSENRMSSCDIPPFVLKLIPFLCQWVISSQEPPSEEIIELLPYAVNVIRYTLSKLHIAHKSLETDHVNRHVLPCILTAVSIIGIRNETVAVWKSERLPEVLEHYIQIEWIEYNNTARLIRKRKTKPETQPSDQWKQMNKHGEDEQDLEHPLGQLQEVQAEQSYLIGRSVQWLTGFIGLCGNTKDRIQTHDVYARLCNFAVANLSYLGTIGVDNTLTLSLMAMGVKLLQSLHQAHNIPQDYRAVPFFESCVNLLSDVHQTSTIYCKRSNKNKYATITVKPRFQKNWESFVKGLWMNTIDSMSECISIYPSLCQCILAADWIPRILKMLKQVRAELDIGYHTYYGKVLTACARCDAECKNSILKNNGLAIAKKFHFDDLEKILK